mmetsp:Transcript_104857/g.302552  ORF Transcript_104857/g.302552 Transcript_104857/m.302552 type:complete len:258 (+) Transcript_104857:119-892(+)
MRIACGGSSTLEATSGMQVACISCPRLRCGRRRMYHSLSPARMQNRFRQRLGSWALRLSKNPAHRVQLSSFKCDKSCGWSLVAASSSDASEPEASCSSSSGEERESRKNQWMTSSACRSDGGCVFGCRSAARSRHLFIARSCNWTGFSPSPSVWRTCWIAPLCSSWCTVYTMIMAHFVLEFDGSFSFWTTIWHTSCAVVLEKMRSATAGTARLKSWLSWTGARRACICICVYGGGGGSTLRGGGGGGRGGRRQAPLT